MNYGYQICGLEFAYLMKAEQGTLDPFSKHHKSYWCKRTQSMADDYGYGVSECYHPEVTEDPRYFTDWKWNIQETCRLYKEGTTFYGKRLIPQIKHFFKIN